MTRAGETNATRREILKTTGLMGAGAVVGSMLLAKVGLSAAIATPSQPEGPFYPVKDQLDKDADLTHVKGHAEMAKGERVLLYGRVLDGESGDPIAGAVVEFWQACDSGKYDHPSDPNDAVLDENFQYWAQVRTDPYGTFSLKTIRPGAYPAAPGWVRPPHIHVKVHKEGYPSLTTQLYFKGDPLNDSDQILGRLTAAERALIEVEFTTSQVLGGTSGRWTVFLKKKRPVGSRIVGAGMTTPEIE